MLLGMTNSTEGIAAKVRGVAAEKRFTQQRIADTLGLSRTSVVERFGGRVPWSATELFDLADAMRVHVARFFPEPHEAPARASSAPAPDAAADRAPVEAVA